MNTKFKLVLAVTTGVLIGGVTQGLHAQSKLKAYSVNEYDVVESSAQTSYLAAVRKAIEAAHGHSLLTANGKITVIEGSAPSKHVGIVEWDSAEDAVAFYKSKAWTDLKPERDKAQKIDRRYILETEK